MLPRNGLILFLLLQGFGFLAVAARHRPQTARHIKAAARHLPFRPVHFSAVDYALLGDTPGKAPKPQKGEFKINNAGVVGGGSFQIKPDGVDIALNMKISPPGAAPTGPTKGGPTQGVSPGGPPTGGAPTAAPGASPAVGAAPAKGAPTTAAPGASPAGAATPAKGAPTTAAPGASPAGAATPAKGAPTTAAPGASPAGAATPAKGAPTTAAPGASTAGAAAPAKGAPTTAAPGASPAGAATPAKGAPTTAAPGATPEPSKPGAKPKMCPIPCSLTPKPNAGGGAKPTVAPAAGGAAPAKGAPTTAAPGSSAAGGSSFEKEALDVHNKFRKVHEAPPLTPNAEMSKEATAYAEKIAKMGTLQHASNSERKGYGENLSMGCSSTKGQSATEAVTNWYNEICTPGYSFGTESVGGAGHFTQVVWKESKELGIGKADIDKNGMKCTYIVGRYKPAGNMISNFGKNVMKGSFDKSYCNTIKSKRSDEIEKSTSLLEKMKLLKSRGYIHKKKI